VRSSVDRSSGERAHVPHGELRADRPIELVVVVPTYCERANIVELAQRLRRVLTGIQWELMLVDDDSPDGTADVARSLSRTDRRVRCIQRVGRRGLSSACIEGIMTSSAPYVAVMDSDMQHDEAILGQMFRRITQGDVDLVVGSRYVDGGGTGDWSKYRLWASRFATKLSGRLTRTPINDPMSGFFMVQRDVFVSALPNLSSVGFKILLDLAASTPEPLRVAEVPYTFRTRQHGESKLDSLVLWEYLQLLLDKMFGHVIPVRFISFVLVGGFGVLVHFSVLTLLFAGLGEGFGLAQLIATLVATSNNFFLNNMLTYRDQRLKGRTLFFGWVTFNLVCLTGALANVGVARWLFAHHNYWQIAALAGIAVTTVWNYAMSSIFTWKRRG
jgi:dolichol-phosphate mannosyltransferase